MASSEPPLEPPWPWTVEIPIYEKGVLVGSRLKWAESENEYQELLANIAVALQPENFRRYDPECCPTFLRGPAPRALFRKAPRKRANSAPSRTSDSRRRRVEQEIAPELPRLLSTAIQGIGHDTRTPSHQAPTYYDDKDGCDTGSCFALFLLCFRKRMS